MNLLEDIFNNTGKTDENEVSNQHANMSAAAETRPKSEQAKDQGVWIELDEVNLVDADLRIKTNIQIFYLGNHLSHRENSKVPGQEHVNSDPRGTRGPKREKVGPNLIKEDQATSRVTGASIRENF